MTGEERDEKARQALLVMASTLKVSPAQIAEDFGVSERELKSFVNQDLDICTDKTREKIYAGLDEINLGITQEEERAARLAEW